MFKAPILVSIAAGLLAVSASSRADDNDPHQGRLVIVDVRETYVPVGFDDNDEALAVVDGMLPSTCYKVAQSEVKVDPATRKVSIVQYARRFPGVCIEVMVPFFSEARLGTLPMGDYTVEANGAAAVPLKVKEASSAGPDDYLYAPVDSARIESETDGKLVAIVSGRFTSSCMKISDVRVTDSGSTVELLPIMEMVDRPNCVVGETPFSWRVELPATLTPGRHLLHVRSLNGKSVNQMFAVVPAH